MKYYLIQFGNNDPQIITEKKLKKIEENADRFDGFVGLTHKIELRPIPLLSIILNLYAQKKANT